MARNGRKQRREIIEKAQEDETSLGNVLLRMGVIKEGDLRAAVKLQQDQDRLLGKLLVMTKIISEEELEEAVRTQADLRHRHPARGARAVARIATRRVRSVLELGTQIAELGEAVTRKSQTGTGFPAVVACQAGDKDS
jgi:hypothetical protein